MKTSFLWKISVTTTEEAEEAVAALLERLFAETASIYTEAETRATTITVFCSKPSKFNPTRKTALEAGLRHLESCGVDIGATKITVSKVPREDWSESWKKFFKTLQIGSKLLIKPSWSKRRPRKNQAVVVLDPGLSFGTGQHPTTFFCLQQLVDCRNKKQSQALLDIGTGSGILAIAAAKLGYAPVDAFDFDPLAVRIAKANARRNRVESLITMTRKDLTKIPAKGRQKYHVICANLISDLLIGEQQRILARLHPQGRLVLAGILASQFPEVQQAYEAAGLTLVATQRENEWQSGAFAFAAPKPS